MTTHAGPIPDWRVASDELEVARSMILPRAGVGAISIVDFSSG